ncbi:hypothetical protein JCGZ_15909 [Jatropha curcas]|uniref:CHCH domain-containing protein n=1 Tax=Jatropha curcas TaxID=180498 RepID=A0A067KZ91_JATCU|nr:coiled-coil-helix-coiled-coil-helix domain-containing protein 10, mitochondrial [Jatropha curcas]KDP41502.1 hypothetical protein JCGZ_15909 [Jatropha curcas]
MPRRSRSSRGGGSSRPAAARSPPRSRPPKPAAQSPPPAPAKVANLSAIGGLGAAIADGVAWGTGTALGRRIADAVMGPPVIRHEAVASSAPAAMPLENTISKVDACDRQAKALQECLNNYGSDISKCQFYMDMMQECRRSSGVRLNA